LRLDHDVIFRGDNSGIGDLGLFKAVACSLRAYQSRLAQPTVSTFLFSASYNYRELLSRAEGMIESKEEMSESNKAENKMDVFEAWSRAFATRVYPALVADPKKIRQIATRNIPDKERNEEWDKYVIPHLDDALARQFYGLTGDKAVLEVKGLNGITSVGAHPLYAVISGALLCLSEGAILDLPPFSNFRNNVMWIDDHLKYSLHRAMNHFTSDETLNLEPGLSDARLDTVTVTKARPPVSDLPGYIFGTYLPVLLWGTIMDAWISNDSILKRRHASLHKEEKALWRKARSEQHNAPLPRAMLTTLSTGHFSNKADLITELEKSAVERIEKVRQLWAKLKRNGRQTFASYWAEGKVKKVFRDECFKNCIEKRNQLWEGIAPGRPLDQPITHVLDLSNAMSQKVQELCLDAAAYVGWTLHWPNFVQIVRSIRQGDFMGDLGWRPEDLNRTT
jgi:regulator of sigma D